MVTIFRMMVLEFSIVFNLNQMLFLPFLLSSPVSLLKLPNSSFQLLVYISSAYIWGHKFLDKGKSSAELGNRWLFKIDLPVVVEERINQVVIYNLGKGWYSDWF